MKERNVYNQLKLLKAQRFWRQKQYHSMMGAVCSFEQDGASKAARVFEHQAVYLAFIAHRLEASVQERLNQTEKHVSEIHSLVGESPVDACLAQALGVIEGLNIIGGISADLLMRAHRALNNATAMVLGRTSQQGLPMFANDPSEDLLIACAQTRESAVPGMADIVKRCIEQATKHNVRAANVVEFLSPSISSYVNAVSMSTSANAFQEIAQFLNQPFSEKGNFDGDPAENSQAAEFQIARALAAGHAADVILAHIQEEDLWNIQFLN
jgi:hypothetical protein